MNYSKYEDILEIVPTTHDNNNNNNIDTFQEVKSNETMISLIKNILNQFKNSGPLIISLSGGVDSMVLMYIVKKVLNINTIAIHLNYNNRSETKKEAYFLRKYCEYLEVPFELKELDIRRGSINRTKYELITKNERFLFYCEMLKKYDSIYILLGHHKDDIIENIFNNVCRDNDILNLSVIGIHSKILGVDILRPLINVFKNDIYTYSIDYNIPYFKDTTPDWCMRGIFRRQLLPILEKSYNTFKLNLLNIDKQCCQWSNIIEINIIRPFLNTIKHSYDENNYIESIEFNADKHIEYDFVFWKTIIKRIFHCMLNMNCPSDKSIKYLIEKISLNSDISCKFILTKQTITQIHNYNIILIVQR